MDLKTVETFVLVAKELSFARAAQSLQLSQPSVTARIQSLEMELGKCLFDRNRRKIRLAKEGEAFLPYAVRLLDVKVEAEDTLKNMNQALQGKISIGATALWSVHILPAVLGEVLQRFPAIEFQVMTGTTAQITEMLLNNQIDIGLVSSRVKNKLLKQVHFAEDEMVLICDPTHPYAKRTSIELEEFLFAPLIIYQRHSDAWKQICAIFEKHDQKPNVVMELNQIEAAKEMVLASQYLCILPEMSVARELRDRRLMRVRVSGLERICAKMSIVYLARKQSYVLVRILTEMLNRFFKTNLEA